MARRVTLPMQGPCRKRGNKEPPECGADKRGAASLSPHAGRGCRRRVSRMPGPLRTRSHSTVSRAGFLHRRHSRRHWTAMHFGIARQWDMARTYVPACGAQASECKRWDARSGGQGRRALPARQNASRAGHAGLRRRVSETRARLPMREARRLEACGRVPETGTPVWRPCAPASHHPSREPFRVARTPAVPCVLESETGAQEKTTRAPGTCALRPGNAGLRSGPAPWRAAPPRLRECQPYCQPPLINAPSTLSASMCRHATQCAGGVWSVAGVMRLHQDGRQSEGFPRTAQPGVAIFGQR